MFDNALKKIKEQEQADKVYVWHEANYSVVIAIKDKVKYMVCSVYSPFFNKMMAA
jgi:hypothetical protein